MLQPTRVSPPLLLGEPLSCYCLSENTLCFLTLVLSCYAVGGYVRIWWSPCRILTGMRC